MLNRILINYQSITLTVKKLTEKWVVKRVKEGCFSFFDFHGLDTLLILEINNSLIKGAPNILAHQHEVLAWILHYFTRWITCEIQHEKELNSLDLELFYIEQYSVENKNFKERWFFNHIKKKSRLYQVVVNDEKWESLFHKKPVQSNAPLMNSRPCILLFFICNFYDIFLLVS